MFGIHPFAYIQQGECRDCANGFLIAELLSRYFPKDINMRTYENGRSSYFRNDNWMQIQDACRKHGFQLPGELVGRVMREQHGAAVQLLELLYEHLTGKKLLRAGDVEEDEDLHRQSMEKVAAKSSSPARLPGTEGAFAIKAVSKPLEPLQFGEVEQRDVGDAATIRERFSKKH